VSVHASALIERVEVTPFVVPTASPESDGTFEWDKTTLHAHVGCALAPVIHVEYFFDHARIEDMLFDGALTPRGGALEPDRSRPGLGLELKRSEAARYAA
jgi:hypothetical protein